MEPEGGFRLLKNTSMSSDPSSWCVVAPLDAASGGALPDCRSAELESSLLLGDSESLTLLTSMVRRVLAMSIVDIIRGGF